MTMRQCAFGICVVWCVASWTQAQVQEVADVEARASLADMAWNLDQMQPDTEDMAEHLYYIRQEISVLSGLVAGLDNGDYRVEVGEHPAQLFWTNPGSERALTIDKPLMSNYLGFTTSGYAGFLNPTSKIQEVMPIRDSTVNHILTFDLGAAVTPISAAAGGVVGSYSVNLKPSTWTGAAGVKAAWLLAQLRIVFQGFLLLWLFMSCGRALSES